jgi:alkylation response protein AidB-like acyl-CoA dehydrogenase
MSFDFQFSAKEEAFRGELRAFLSEELPTDHWRLQNDREPGREGQQEFNEAFRKKLAARGWLTMHWPKEYGGLGAGHMQQLIFNEEMAYHAAPTGGMAVQMAGPTIMHHGTEEQREKHLAAIAASEEVWCQGFSEPGAGSDLASLQTRAVRDGDDYVVNGQKIWNSGGHLADWCMLLVRTDPEAAKHRGISYLLVDMKSPGVEVRPLINMMSSHAFNEIYFEDVRVPRRNLVGEENRGWYVATTTLDYERSGIARIMWGRRMLEEMIAYTRSAGSVSAGFRNRLADLWIASETARLMAYRVTWLQSQGQVPNYEASMSKLFSSEVQQAITQAGVSMLGAHGGLRRGSAGDPLLQGSMSEAYMATVSYTIAAGTSEVQRNIMATRGLGLPRS